MRIEITVVWRHRLALCALFATSFGLTALVTRPSIDAPTPVVPAALAPVPQMQPALRVADAEEPLPASVSEEQYVADTPSPTLQELAVAGDVATRDEASVLLGALDAEAAFD